jgi:hypothetical protein
MWCLTSVWLFLSLLCCDLGKRTLSARLVDLEELVAIRGVDRISSERAILVSGKRRIEQPGALPTVRSRIKLQAASPGRSITSSLSFDLMQRSCDSKQQPL